LWYIHGDYTKVNFPDPLDKRDDDDEAWTSEAFRAAERRIITTIAMMK
jgi:hypothetical protein